MARAYRKLPPLSPQDINRFWSKLDMTDGPDSCWPFIGGRFSFGHGAFSLANSNYKASRIAYLLHYGIDPGDLLVRHVVCNAPACCNPKHLELGTDFDNVHDREAWGGFLCGDKNPSRQHPERLARGEKHGCARLTDEQVRAIRAEYPALNFRQIAKKYGVWYATVRNIVQRRTWKHLE